ncbi:MAG: ABC transporter ATP-binding protein [Clostridia bacterium]|nr:ABC transporter ATP-binding protein [Clostridia bacterium]
MIVELAGVKLTYQSPDGEVPALAGIDLTVHTGEFISVVGPSGCGKSTLLNMIAGLEVPDAGTVSVGGRPLHGPSRTVGYMPQKDGLFPWRSIWGNVTLGLEIAGENTPERQEEVRDLLSRYGLADFAAKSPAELSGGMRQRCALIRTLACGPELLLLDEAFSALDYQTRLAVSADIYSIIRREKKTAILVTHDISEAVSLSDRIVLLTRRPARIKQIYSLDELQGIPPLERRDHPAFRAFFNAIWKELDVHV